MGKIILNNKTINKVKLGPSKVKQVFVGDELVWPNNYKDLWTDYDVIEEGDYDSISLLYTTDTHGYWGYWGDKDDTTYQSIQNLSPRLEAVGTAWSFSTVDNSKHNTVKNLKDYLKSNKSYPILVDAGDTIFDKQSRNPKIYNTSYFGDGENSFANWMNSAGILLTVPGNNDFEWEVISGFENCFESYSSKVPMTCCNMFKAVNGVSTGELVFKPYRTVKVGKKKLAFIGVGWPNWDFIGCDVPPFVRPEWAKNYYWEDAPYDPKYNGNNPGVDWSGSGNNLYTIIQNYIDLFKANNFDYIFIVPHLPINGAGLDTSDNTIRERAGIKGIIENTSGLTGVFVAHSHALADQTSIKDKTGKDVILFAQPRCDFKAVSVATVVGNNITSSNLLTMPS